MAWSFGNQVNIHQVGSDEIAASQSVWSTSNATLANDVATGEQVQSSVDAVTSLIDTIINPSYPEPFSFQVAGNLDESAALQYFAQLSITQLRGFTLPLLTPNTLRRDITAVTSVSTTSPVTVFQHTIPGGMMVGDHGIDFYWVGSNALLSNIGDTDYTWEVYLGATRIGNFTATIISSVSAPLTAIQIIEMRLFANNDPNAQVYFIHPTNDHFSGAGMNNIYATAAVDMNQDQLLSVVVTMSRSHANAQMKHLLGIIQFN